MLDELKSLKEYLHHLSPDDQDKLLEDKGITIDSDEYAELERYVLGDNLGETKKGDVLDEVRKERERQDNKWGEQNHSPAEWLMILGEEVGEANKAALETHFNKTYKTVENDYSYYREELIQVAATAVVAIEALDRNKK